MKISATSLFIILFSLASSLNVRNAPPGHDEERKEVAPGPPKWPLEMPPPVDDITFFWCQSYGRAETCSSKNLKHGACYDFGVLDPKIQDMLEEVGTSGGQCMLFRFRDCKGSHTPAFTGEHLWTPWLCPGRGKSYVKWNRDARSVRCCSGPPSTPWCSSTPKNPDKCYQKKHA